MQKQKKKNFLLGCYSKNKSGVSKVEEEEYQNQRLISVFGFTC